MEDQPSIIELDPESAPRTSAIILVLCGVLGVAFFVINVAFTGDDPYQRMTDPEYSDGIHPLWEGEDRYPLQEGYHIMPNLWRGREAALSDEPPEEEIDPLQKGKLKKATPTTGPALPGQPAAPGGTGTPSAPATPNSPNPFTVNKPGDPPAR
jgi:hypothetical protein